MGGITKPISVKDPVTGQVSVYPTSTMGYNVTDPGPDPNNVSAVAQVTNDPAAFPVYAKPPAAPAPAPAAAPPPTSGPASSTSGLLSQPGAYEEWLKSHMGQLDDPTRVENMYDGGAASSLSNSPLSGVQDFSGGSYAAWLAGQGGAPSAGNSAGVLGGISGGPSSGPNMGNSAGVLGGLSQGPSSGPSSGLSAGVLSTLATGPSLSTRAAELAFKGLADPGAMESFYSMYGGGNGDLMSPGYTEKLYEQGMSALDPAYDYASKRAIQQAQTASAARGSFNTGLAAQQESDILGNLRGQQAHEQVSLAPQADAARIAREGLASTLANNAESQENNRYSTLSGIAAAGDAADLGRNQLRSTTANNADTQSTNAYNAFWNQTNDAAQNRIDAAQNADTAAGASFNDYWNATSSEEQNRIDAAQNADTSAIDAFTAGAGAQRGAEQQGLADWQANTDLASTKDAANRSNVNALFNIAGGADASDLTRLTTQGQMAQDLQSTGQNRILGGLGAISGENTTEAKITQQILSDTANIDQMDDTKLQALADKYGVSLDELKSVKGDITSVVSLLSSVAKGGAGGGGSVGANGAPIVD